MNVRLRDWKEMIVPVATIFTLIGCIIVFTTWGSNIRGLCFVAVLFGYYGAIMAAEGDYVERARRRSWIAIITIVVASILAMIASIGLGFASWARLIAAFVLITMAVMAETERRMV